MAPKTPANSSRRAQHDSQESSIDTLITERDHYKRKYKDGQATQAKVEDKLDSAHRDLREAKNEIKRLQEINGSVERARATLEQACKQLTYERDQEKAKNVSLRNSYDSLRLKYEAIPEDRRNPMVSVLPERRRNTGSASSGSNSGVPLSSAASRQSGERGRAAEKENLARRFESSTSSSTMTSSMKKPPLTSGTRRSSTNIEGFGRRRSMSGAPSSRIIFADVAQTPRYEEVLISPRDSIAFSQTVPRRVPSSAGYHSGGSGAMSDEYEDGDYHLRPIR